MVAQHTEQNERINTGLSFLEHCNLFGVDDADEDDDAEEDKYEGAASVVAALASSFFS